jgi:hypothetical protein
MWCIDLRSIGRYRVWNEVEDRWATSRDDPGDLIVPGRYGFMATWGPSTLAACTNGRKTTDKILAAVPGARVVQDGDDGQNVVFPSEHHQAVAVILVLRRHKTRPAEAASHLKAHRFAPQGFGE